MKKWLLLAVLAGLAVLAYAAAGPYLTMHRIEKSIAAQNLDSLSAQIDFPAVRAGLKVQLQRKIEAETPDLLKEIPLLNQAVTTLSSVNRDIRDERAAAIRAATLLASMAPAARAPQAAVGLAKTANCC